MLSSIPSDFYKALTDAGYYSTNSLVPETLCNDLLEELLLIEAKDGLSPAGTGRGADYTIDPTVRRDKILWLNGDTKAQHQFLKLMQDLRLLINRNLFLGLSSYEAHFAHYGPGDFYKLHRDSFVGAANRVLLTVLYLNPEWQRGDGGVLRIYDRDGKQIREELEPKFATMVIFLSEEIWHEVSPAKQPRRSIAGWFRMNTGLDPLLAPA